MSWSLRYGSGRGSPCLFNSTARQSVVRRMMRRRDIPHCVTNGDDVIPFRLDLTDPTGMRENALGDREIGGARVEEDEGSRNGGRYELS